MGFSIIGGQQSVHGDSAIYVKTVFDTKEAGKNRGLKPGDQILSVNGHTFDNITYERAKRILVECEGLIRLSILPSTYYPFCAKSVSYKPKKIT